MRKCALGGCGNNATQLASGQSPWDIAVDATNVYWTNHTNPGSVLRLPK